MPARLISAPSETAHSRQATMPCAVRRSSTVVVLTGVKIPVREDASVDVAFGRHIEAISLFVFNDFFWFCSESSISDNGLVLENGWSSHCQCLVD